MSLSLTFISIILSYRGQIREGAHDDARAAHSVCVSWGPASLLIFGHLGKRVHVEVMHAGRIVVMTAGPFNDSHM